MRKEHGEKIVDICKENEMARGQVNSAVNKMF